MAAPAVQPRDGLGPWLEERLYEFNMDASGHCDGAELGFAVEEDGEVVAGLSGYTWGGIADVKQLWVREDRRKAGLGSALMAAAVAEAKARGCTILFLTTHSFQAPRFYKRLGFEEIAVIENKPLGHGEHVMRLALR